MNLPITKWQSECREYNVIIPESCLTKLRKLASSHYPNEIGSSLVGCYSKCGYKAYILRPAPISSDSKGTRKSFYRGIAGLRRFFIKLREDKSGKQYYVGEWHSHPDSEPYPSTVDNKNQMSIASDVDTNCPECVLIILGGSPPDFQKLGVFVYSRTKGAVVLHPSDNKEDT